MCGIFCVVKKRGKINSYKCKKTLSRLNHRGPDWNFYKIFDEKIFMGQTVLSMTGNKKKKIENHMSSSRNSLLLYNGEIYNYKHINNAHLKEKLEGIYSDTKVFVNLIEEKQNKNFYEYLDGMYAFVFYNKNKLIIGRDPQGEKIIYFYEDRNEIIFSSEINSIVYYLENFEINYGVLSSYFLTRHFSLIDKTTFKNIQILKPGYEIELNLKNLNIKLKERINLSELIDENEHVRLNRISIKDLVKYLDYLLNKNIKEMIPEKRLFGSILSGGVDSSLVSKYVSKNSLPLDYIFVNHQGKDLHTVHMDEFSKNMGKKIKIINVNKEKYYRFYKKCLNINCSPINSHSWVGQMIISSYIKKIKGKALFGGEGADELFGGYETYRQKIKNININNSNYSKFLNHKFLKKNPYLPYFKKYFEKKWKDANKIYYFLPKQERYRAAMMYMDLTIQMSSNGLRGADLMGMANSVEMRSVFFRKEILKFGLNLPLKYKISLNDKDDFKTKILLKKVYLKYFPKKLLLEKQGFAGFPNEIKTFLPNKDFSLKNVINKNFFKTKNVYDRNLDWKIVNSKYFINRFGKNK